MRNNKVCFAILGYGHIGKRHAQLISQNQHAELSGIIDLQLFTNTAKNEYNSLDDFLKHDKDTDIVIIATPNGLHFQHAKECILAGKHVLIEKPIALNSSDIDELIKLSEHENVRIFPAWQLRYVPEIIALKTIIESHNLGEIYWVQADCFWNRGQEYYHKHAWHGKMNLDGGPLYTQFSHIVDLISWIFGDIVIDNSKFFKLNKTILTDFEDSGTINFTVNKNTVGLLNYTTLAPFGTSSNLLTIIGEKGKIKLEGQYLNILLQGSINCNFEQMDNSNLRDHCIQEALKDVINSLLSRNSVIENYSELKNATLIIEHIYHNRMLV